MPAPYSYESMEEYLKGSELGRQIIRIRDNVSAALTAIGNKGVTVPSGSNSDDLADLISSIQTGGGTPSATQHTILFEFSDSTNTTITAYWDGTFISDAIRATVPTTYDNKVVQQASLDGTAWYTRSTELWEVVYDDISTVVGVEDDKYFWISSLSDVPIPSNSRWRITCDGVERLHTSYFFSRGDFSAELVGAETFNDELEPIDCPYAFYNGGFGAWIGMTSFDLATSHHFKVERLVTV